MRKHIGLGLAAAVIAAALAAPVTAAPKKQSITGSFVTPGKYADNTCYAGGTRRLALASNGAINGVTGYHFDVEPSTLNKPFVLTPTGGQGRIDLDITFYTDFGDIDPTTAPAGTYAYENRTTTGEAGKVPVGMTKAIVCMYIDETQTPPAGVAASFTYEAGKGVKVPKG